MKSQFPLPWFGKQIIQRLCGVLRLPTDIADGGINSERVCFQSPTARLLESIKPGTIRANRQIDHPLTV
jgi:hypothetical protein